MTQKQLEALLGRPLTPNEVTNRELYLEIARESLEELLCISLDSDDDTSGSGDEEFIQEFDVREGYSTVFTGIFTSVTEVKVDGKVTTDYYPALWDKRKSAYYNSIVLSKPAKVAEITAYWGFDTLPSDLQLLWSQLFANVSKKYKASELNVKRKKVRNFDISYGDLTDDEAFLSANKRTIQKYSLCNIGYVLHGNVCSTHRSRSCGCV